MPRGFHVFNLSYVSPIPPGIVQLISSFRIGALGKSTRCPTRSLATVPDLTTATQSLDLRGPIVINLGLSTTICPTMSIARSQPAHTVLATIYSFPKMEPIRFTYYPSTHLQIPLRRDILQRAVIFEGDNQRQGSANTKWRNEVRGSGRKLAPQKGLGRARVGDKKSPTRKGGGVAFGPKPRDFGTELPRKIYDRAWRTALSHRYQKGELIVVDRLSGPSLPGRASASWLEEVFGTNGLGCIGGKSLLVAEGLDQATEQLHAALESYHGSGNGARLACRLVNADDVDVKDLLSMARVIIEHRALNRIFHEHSSDLTHDFTARF